MVVTRTTRNRFAGETARGFESHRLRHIKVHRSRCAFIWRRKTSFTPQIRRHSSAGQSARFTSVRSWVQVPLSPPKEKGTERCLFLLVQRHLAQPNAALYDRASLQRKLVWLAGAQSRQCRVFRFALCVVFAEFAKGKLVSLPGRSPGNASFPHTRPLPHVGAKSALLRLLFLPAAEKKPSARSLAPPFSQKGTLGSPARL